MACGEWSGMDDENVGNICVTVPSGNHKKVEILLWGSGANWLVIHHNSEKEIYRLSFHFFSSNIHQNWDKIQCVLQQGGGTKRIQLH